jgi:ATP-binding protein involved in chromosome partitioning
LFAWTYLQTLHREQDARWAVYLKELEQKGLNRG